MAVLGSGASKKLREVVMRGDVLRYVTERLARLNGAPHDVKRRALLKGATLLAASSALAPFAGVRAQQAAPRFVAYPFQLGVASGYPHAHGITLWTRLNASPLTPNGAITESMLTVRYEIAADESFGKVVNSGAVGAFDENAHAVRVDVAGLDPARWYHYRFMVGNEVSPVGRTRTTPARGAAVDRLRFAIGTCQHYEQGYYAAHRHLLDEDLDLMLFLGDYIYESSWGDTRVRRHVNDEAYTLEQYRLRYAQYRADEDLQRMHARVPWVFAWDDHEVDNDWAGGTSEHLDPQFLVRRAAAFQAYWENMPLPRRMWPSEREMRIYDRVEFGKLATFHMLDDRQYRTAHPCPDAYKGAGSRTLPEADCRVVESRALTMLGDAQSAWLDEGLARPAQWHLLGQQTLMAPLWGVSDDGRRTVWTDGWDAYRASRTRVLRAMQKHDDANHVVLGGDIHATAIADVHRDVDDAKSPVVASEFCGTSVTAQGWGASQFEARLKLNPHIHYGDDTRRGYLAFELTPSRLTCAVRNLEDVTKSTSGIATAATFVVEDGRPGPKRTA